jgi:arginyl-tRNA synthetase
MNTLDLTVPGIRDHVQQRARAALQSLGIQEEGPDLVPPPNPEMGDLGFPCFAYAKVMRKAPPMIAQEVAAAMAPDDLIAEVITDKAYVNVKLHPEALIAIVLRQALGQGDRYGADQAAPAERWMVEYSAPNTNKPLHLGHLRNNLLGSSVARILAYYGHEVTRINLVNDRGVHICKSMLAYQRWGAESDPAQSGEKGDQLVGRLYVLFDQKFSEEYAAWKGTDAASAHLATWLESKKGKQAQKAHQKGGPAPEEAFFSSYKDTYFNTDSPLGAEARDLLRRWEDEDAEVRTLWRKMNDWVLAGHDASYARMGVGFDHVQYESETYKLGKSIVEQGLASGALEKLDEGAVICDLTKVGLKGQKVLLRSDGTSVYMTQDLGTAVERFDQYKLDHSVYVVGDEQLYHFDVLFRILGLLRPGLGEACYHLAYGMIRLPEGKMKSREGTVVDADDLMDEVHRLAAEETRSKAAEGKAHTENITDEELDHRAEQIGMAAIKYFLLKFSPKKSFEYDPRASIDFLGQTGPYCLFNYARTRALLRKAGGEDLSFNAEAAARLGTEGELAVVRQLMGFPAVVGRAAEGLDPSRIAEYLFDLCKSFAFIFTDKTNHPIVTCEDPQLRQGRLMLAAAVGETLRAGLGLLGIVPLEEM